MVGLESCREKCEKVGLGVGMRLCTEGKCWVECGFEVGGKRKGRHLAGVTAVAVSVSVSVLWVC